MNGLYTNFYSLTHDDGPNSHLEMVMGLIGLATDMVGGPGKEGAAVAAKIGKKALEEIGTASKGFAPGKWLSHFQKHAAEFNFKNSVEYLRGAQRLTGGGEGILTHQLHKKALMERGKGL